jgi:hypothetical protein
MRLVLLIALIFSSLFASAQQERDTVLRRCPVFITDTLTSNNFFIEGRPCTIKVYRVKGDLTIVVEQRDQFLTILFSEKKLRNTKYRIHTHPEGRSEIAVKYSFRSGEQVSYVDVVNGTVETNFDQDTNSWKIRINGMIANLVERTITYYRVKADFSIL